MLRFKTLFPILIIFPYSYLLSQNLNRLFDEYLNSYYLNKQIPSISAGVLKDGEIIWSSTKGLSDLENNIPATNKTLYRIASISKSITAVGIMQLVEAGRINLDDNVRKYIPYLPPKLKPFTVRQLLNHTSGIRSYQENEFDSKKYFSSTRDVIIYLMKDSLEYTPGERYLYSTLGYNLLAAIIENVSGMSYADYLKKKIFEPAGMASTIPDYQKNLIFNRARGYERNLFRQLQNAPLADLSIKYAGGGLLSTTDDLLRFASNLLNGRLLKHETLDSMLIPARLNNGKYINYGLGFSFATDETGRKSFSHSGAGTGFTGHLIIYPDENIAAVYLVNIRDRNLENPAKALLAITRLKEKYPVKKSLADYLMSEYTKTSIDSVLNIYYVISSDSLNPYSSARDELYLFGNDLLALNQSVDAIKYFKFLSSQFPDDPAIFVGLGNAYFADGNKGLALRNFRLALRFDPKNTFAKNMINKIIGLN